MFGSEACLFSFWWFVPIVMMVLCFLMMRGARRATMGGFGCCGRDMQRAGGPASASDILDRRYASGEIDKAAYEEMKTRLTASAVAETAGEKAKGGSAP